MPILHFKGRTYSGRSKPVEYIVLENGCWRCTSHSHRKTDDRVTIRINGEKDYLYRFVYREFKGDIEDDLVIRHMCNNPYCLNPKHLEIGTHQDNVNDKVRSGNVLKGEDNPHSKYSSDQVSEAKRLINEGELTMKDISSITGIAHSTLLRICNGTLWKVEGEILQPKTKRLKYSLEKRELIKQDVAKGMTYKEIQKIHNVSAGFIYDLKQEMKGVLK